MPTRSLVLPLLLLTLFGLAAAESAHGVMFSDDFDPNGLDPSWTVGLGAFDASGGVLVESSTQNFMDAQLFWDGGLTAGADQVAKLQVVTSGSHTWGFMFRTEDVSGHHYQVHLPIGGNVWKWELNDPAWVEEVDSCVGDVAVQDGDWLGATVVGAGTDAVVSVWRWDSDPDLGASPDPDATWGVPDCTMSADPTVTSDGLGLGIRAWTGNPVTSASADNWSGGDLPVGICGNSVVEGVEDCDDGMETASCNGDCTFAACGDGYFNPLAETCEVDANCSGGEICTSMCACIVEPVCGNFIVEYGEDCDEGAVQTASCEADCAFPMCGDGHLNIGAGEACEDDGDCAMGERCDMACSCEVASGQLFSDTFDGPGLDPAWTVMTGSFSVSSGALVESSAVPNHTSQLRWDGATTDTPDQFSKLQLVNIAGRSWGFMFRLGDSTGHHYEVHLPSTTAEWRWEIGNPGFVGLVGTCVGDVPPQDGDWIGAAVQDVGASTTVSVWRWDGDPDPGLPDPNANWGEPDCQMTIDPSVDVDDGLGLGLRSFTGSQPSPSTVDNWSGGDLLAPIPPPGPGPIVRILSSSGAGVPNSMLDPDGIAIDSADNVYVAACGLGPTSEGVFRIEPGGAITQVLDTNGDGVNPAHCPVGLAVDSADNVYVAAFISDNVFEIDPNGVITEVLDAVGGGVAPLEGPLGVAVDPNDTVIVTGHFSDNVFALPASGGVQVILDALAGGTGTPLEAPFGVTTDALGNVYVAGFGLASEAVFKIAPGGGTSIVLDAAGDGAGNTLAAPHCLVVGPMGDLYVTGNMSDNVFRVTPLGDVSVIADIFGDEAGNPMNNPTSIAVDGAGNVYVAAFSSDNGFVIEPNQVPVEIIDSTGDGKTPYGMPSDFVMALDSLGYIYTAGIVGDAVFKIEPLPEPGALIQLLAGSGMLGALARHRRRRR